MIAGGRLTSQSKDFNEKERMILAWSKHPEPKGTIYFENDLINPQTVTNLFSYCQISAGYINSDGWEFLFNTFGMSALFDLKTTSGWENSVQKESPFSDLVYQSFISGYNPLHHEKGDYDEAIELFLSLDGFKRIIDWSEIEKMDLH
ncbi:MAG TPA: hypothetical protein VF691_16110 [Cytophagaceae bacterium]